MADSWEQQVIVRDSTTVVIEKRFGQAAERIAGIGDVLKTQPLDHIDHEIRSWIFDLHDVLLRGPRSGINGLALQKAPAIYRMLPGFSRRVDPPTP